MDSINMYMRLDVSQCILFLEYVLKLYHIVGIFWIYWIVLGLVLLFVYLDLWNKLICKTEIEREMKTHGYLGFYCCKVVLWWFCTHVSYSELIQKYNIKCKENENLRKQQKKSSALLKEYHSKLINHVTKQTPLEEVRNICYNFWNEIWTEINYLLPDNL
jgi:hypothetical protein